MLDYSVGSSMERDDLYAELSFDNIQFAEICLSADKKSLDFIIYPNNPPRILTFKFDELMEIIERAKKQLLQLEPLSK